MRSGDSNRWKTVVFVLAIGGAAGWSLVRYRQVVLAPGRADAGTGAATGAVGNASGGRPDASPSRGRESPLAGVKRRNPDVTAPPPPAFRTADALARQAAAARSGSETAESGDAGVDRPLTPPAWQPPEGTVEETAEARPPDRAPATDVETVGRPVDPGAGTGAEDRLVEEHTGGADALGIAHPGTVAAGLGAPRSAEREADPWGDDAPLGAAGRGPGRPPGEAFGSAAAEALFAPSAGVAADQTDELSPRIEALLPEGVHVDAFAAIGTERDDGSDGDTGAAAGGGGAGAEGIDAGDAMLGLASAQAIGHGMAPTEAGTAEPEPSLAELQGEARDMVLGTGPAAPTGAGGTAGGTTARAEGQPGGAATSAVPEGFVPQGAVAAGGAQECPDGYPIKGNASSRIYHEPGGASYDQTVPEFCFASAEAAENAGYRARKG